MSCSGACGIGAIREAEVRRARAIAALAYPGLLWADTPLAAAPLEEAELRGLADAVDEVVAAWQSLEFHPNGAATLRLHGQFGETIAATAASRLELVVSPLGRLATLREVCTECTGGTRDVVRLGVEDRRWASAVKAIRGLLRERSFTLLDMAFLSSPVPAASQPAYEERYGAALTWWSLLFLPEPPATSTFRSVDGTHHGEGDRLHASVTGPRR
jgi:hypothetical protein